MKRADPRDIARGRWHEILTHFGVPAGSLTGKHGPCPIPSCGGGKDRFRFDNLNGEGTWFCNQCGSGDGFHLAMRCSGKDFKAVLADVERLVVGVTPRPAPVPMSEEAKRDALRRIWKASLPVISGDVVDTYLTGRGVGAHAYPKSLRALSSCRAEGMDCAAMLAVVSDVTGKPHTIHRTFLKPDGSGKAPVKVERKTMPGDLPDGIAVRLVDDWHGGPLGIAEGIETALAASVLFEMPVWSALNATMLTKWSPPEGCTEVAIFGDNDDKFTGQAAAYELAHRLKCGNPGLVVTVHIPPLPEGRAKADWNDHLLMSPYGTRMRRREDAA